MIKKNSPSGVLSIVFIPVEIVHRLRIYNGSFSLYIKYGKNPFDIPFSRESSEINFDNELGGKLAIPNPSKENTSEILPLIGRDGLILMKSISGFYLFGSIQFPVRLSIAHKNNVQIGQYAGYILSFTSNVISLGQTSYSILTKPPVVDPEPTDPSDPKPPIKTDIVIFDTTKTPLTDMLNATYGYFKIGGVIQEPTIEDNLFALQVPQRPDSLSRLAVTFKDLTLEDGNYTFSFESSSDDPLLISFTLNAFATTSIQTIGKSFSYDFKYPFASIVDKVLKLGFSIDYSLFHSQTKPLSYNFSNFKLVKRV